MVIIHSVITDLKEKHGVKKVGLIGYCYGGKLAVITAAEDQVYKQSSFKSNSHRLSLLDLLIHHDL
jgi:dienelactone hydrolase